MPRLQRRIWPSSGRGSEARIGADRLANPRSLQYTRTSAACVCTETAFPVCLAGTILQPGGWRLGLWREPSTRNGPSPNARSAVGRFSRVPLHIMVKS
jgi:hypothetical protein